MLVQNTIHLVLCFALTNIMQCNMLSVVFLASIYYKFSKLLFYIIYLSDIHFQALPRFCLLAILSISIFSNFSCFSTKYFSMYFSASSFTWNCLISLSIEFCCLISVLECFNCDSFRIDLFLEFNTIIIRLMNCDTTFVNEKPIHMPSVPPTELIRANNNLVGHLWAKIDHHHWTKWCL